MENRFIPFFLKFPLYVLFSLFISFEAFSATPLDFSQYRFGYNNRPLFEAIIKDLIAEFGHPVMTAYQQGMQATVDKIIIDESLMDSFLRETNDPKEREALARFVLAHEYFHVALKHTQTSKRRTSLRGIEILGTFSDARKEMEKQVDHLAAKYLHKLGLPTEPIQRLFLNHPGFEGGGEYPSAEERIEAVKKAAAPGIEETYFDNQAIRCVTLLGSLATKLP